MASTVLLVLATACLWLSSLFAFSLALRIGWGMRWAPAILSAYPLWWLAQILTARALSFFEAINQSALIVTALGLALIPGGLALGLRLRGASKPIEPTASIRDRLKRYWLEILALLYLGLSGLRAALIYPSQIWDTYTYHLPMIANWLQQGSLAPWPTANLRQVTRAAGAEFQQLWVIGMPHVDLLAELPSLLASAMIVIFVWEMASRWGASRPVALAAGIAIFAIPQISWGALSSKDDLLLSAGLLCGLFNAIASCAETRRGLGVFHLTAAAISAALVCATKVPGLLFGATLMFFFSLWLLWHRRWRDVFFFSLVFTLAAWPTFGLTYYQNLSQHHALYAEASGDGIPSPTTFWRGHVNSVIYFWKLLVSRATGGVGTHYDASHFGIWFSVVALPLLLLTNWSSLVNAIRQRGRITPGPIAKERMLVALYLCGTFAITLWRVNFRLWDFRFMLWVCPLVVLLAMHRAERFISPIFFRVLCLGFALITFRSVLIAGFPEARRFSLGEIKTQAESRHFRGYKAMEAARPGETVLYVGGWDTSQYPAWGWKYDRIVWAADSPARLQSLFERRPDWVVVEETAPESMRVPALELLSAAGYRRVSAEPETGEEIPLWRQRTIWKR